MSYFHARFKSFSNVIFKIIICVTLVLPEVLLPTFSTLLQLPLFRGIWVIFGVSLFNH